jgi:hemoglobin
LWPRPIGVYDAVGLERVGAHYLGESMRIGALAVAVLVVGGCGASARQSQGPATATSAAAAPAAPAAKRSLYDRLGGKPAITAVVDAFVGRVAGDKRVNARFINTDIPQLKTLFVEFVCVATGGPCKYEGRDMRATHGGMQLVDEEFNAIVEDLTFALNKLKVPAPEQQEILGAIGPLKPQIVNPPPPGAAKHDPALAAQTRKLMAALQKDGKQKAADLLETALTARLRGQRNYAEQLFSFAELQVSPGRLAAIGPLFREGAPERITTKLVQMPKDMPPQPKGVVGASDEDEVAGKPKRGSLTGVLKRDGGPLGGHLGVVTLQPASGHWKPRTPKERVIEQRERQFAPRVMMVPVGSTVSFPNFDPVFHNVFSVSPTKSFDLGLYKNGESRDVTFDKEGIQRLGCNQHASKSAYHVVVAAPQYVVTDANGHFRFRSLQPGKYKLHAWMEGNSEPLTQMVEIKDGANEITVDMHGAARADLGRDKFGNPRGTMP